MGMLKKLMRLGIEECAATAAHNSL
jgi:hypothetical protein